jgi:HK97 family phage prohead protease
MERLAFGLGEVKFAGSDTDMSFAGYGAVFGNVDSYGDVIAKGAFSKTLTDSKRGGNWPAMLSQHGGMLGNDMTPIGVWTEMREDDHGLYVEGKLADTERGREAYSLLKMQPRPALNGLSIGYRATEWSMRAKPDEPRRTLKSIDLYEVSLVTMPANPKARVSSVKNFDPREIEDALRDAGISRSDSVKAVAVLKTLQRDAGEPEDAPRDEKATADARAIAARFEALRA